MEHYLLIAEIITENLRPERPKMEAPPAVSECSAVSRASQILSFLDKVESETDDDLRSCVAGSVHADSSLFKFVSSPQKNLVKFVSLLI